MEFGRTQEQAIRHNEGPMMILAGPGSGKTTVITQRIKYLTESLNINPADILVITFTRAAAEEMKERYIRTYGNSYEIPSPDTGHRLSLVKEECRKTGMVCSSNRLFEYMHTFEDKQAGVQMSLFE